MPSRKPLWRTGAGHPVISLLPTFFLAMVPPCSAPGKRTVPPKAEPVIDNGIRYVAPNDDGRRAYIKAWDVQTNKKLWDLTVFTTPIDPKMEEDVQ